MERTIWVITYSYEYASTLPVCTREQHVLAADEEEAIKAARFYRKNYEQVAAVRDTGEGEYT